MSGQSPSEPRFCRSDLWLIAGIFALGGAGYLCDAHSPIVLPFLPVFGLAFNIALLVLAAAIFRDSIIRRSDGWLAGLTFIALPFIAIVVWLGLFISSRVYGW